MPFRHLPSSPSLDHLKNQAKDLVTGQKTARPVALQVIREFHPDFRSKTDAEIASAKFSQSDAYFTLARQYAFPSWTKLKEYVLDEHRVDRNLPFEERIPDREFRQAVSLSDKGDAERLRRLLADHPRLARQRVYFGEGNYFGQPSLLEFVAENPIRHESMPANVEEIAQIIIDAGADAVSIRSTLGLVATGRVPRETGKQAPLIDLLCRNGAEIKSMRGVIAHAEFEAAEALIRNGAKIDLSEAAGLGRLEDAKRLLPSADPETRHAALALALG